ncbi:hypothetical protein Sjap_018850 [Stephania japonica]|uniref:Uncharacterized protein n=1 Tax=Stephania japonica TaxID=461633 RepID=A0AAP0I8V9_9MAGN
MAEPKYAYPYSSQQGYYGPHPVMAPPHYVAPPPSRPSFVEAWFVNYPYL